MAAHKLTAIHGPSLHGQHTCLGFDVLRCVDCDGNAITMHVKRWTVKSLRGRSGHVVSNTPARMSHSVCLRTFENNTLRTILIDVLDV